MNLKLTCIGISLCTLIGAHPANAATESAAAEARQTIAVLGTGDMGNSFGPRLAAMGYRVVYGSRNPSSDKVIALLETTGHGATATTQKKAAEQAEIVLLALPWPAMETIVKNLGDMDGKVLIDMSYPPLDYAEDGYFEITIETSSAEMIQGWNPQSKVVKAFGTVGSQTIDNPLASGGLVSVPIASDHRDAKETVAVITAELGLDPVDAGPLRMARNIESLQILLMVPLLQNRVMNWSMFFRRSNYWYCNPYADDEGVVEWPPVVDANDLAEFPTTQGPLKPCP